MRATGVVEVDVDVHDTGERKEPARVDLLLGLGRRRLDERHDASVAHEDVARVRAVGDDDRAADREIGARAHSSVMVKSCAPSQSASRPTSARFSPPSVTVAK